MMASAYLSKSTPLQIESSLLTSAGKSKKGFQPKAPTRRNAIPGGVPASSQASVRNSVDRQTQPTVRELMPQPPKVVASLSDVPPGAIAVLAPPTGHQIETTEIQVAKDVANALITTDADSSLRIQRATTEEDRPVSILVPERRSTPFGRSATDDAATANASTRQADATPTNSHEPTVDPDEPRREVEGARETSNLESIRPAEQLHQLLGEEQQPSDLIQNPTKDVRKRNEKKRVRSMDEEPRPSKRARRSSDHGRQSSHEREGQPLGQSQKNRSKRKGHTNQDLNAQHDDPGERLPVPRNRKAGAKPKTTARKRGEAPKKRERRKGKTQEQGARPQRKHQRSPTPTDAENIVIEEDTLRMEELCSERRTGRKSARSEEIKIFEAAEAERRAVAKARELAGEDPLESENQVGIAEAEQETGGQMLAPQTQIVNGEIVLIEDSTRVDRHAMANAEREAEAVVVVEENALTTRINSHYNLKQTPKQRWTDEDTEEFYNALRMFGTDFEIISKMFPTRSRRAIKLKYTHEERVNQARISGTLHGERIPVNIEEFSAWTETTYADPAILHAEMETDRRVLEEEQAKEKEAMEEARRQREAETAAEAAAVGEDASAKENEEQEGGATKKAGGTGKRGESKAQKERKSKGRKGRKRPTFGGGQVEVLGRLEDNVHHQPKMPAP